MAEKKSTPEEREEMRKKETRKDRLHQNYLRRKASGKQKEYEERTRAVKKAQIESKKEQIKAEDREKAMTAPVIVFFYAVIAVSSESIFSHVGNIRLQYHAI